jgi:ATP-dependent protease ClpP protease subunit
MSTPFILRAIKDSPKMTTEENTPDLKPITIPEAQDLLKVEEAKVSAETHTIVLEGKNTVVLKGVVDAGTVSSTIRKLSKISSELSKNETIYLVLDTPGGSVMDGAELIDYLASLPQKVKTVTLFAASMGFHIAESNPGPRLIARSGILMSHRARGGVEGQFDGELESEYRMYKRKTDWLEASASQRIGISVSEYKAKIKDEWWIHGFDAQDQKVADETVLVRCGSTLSGSEETVFETMFGPVTVVFDRCPLIKKPLEIKVDKLPKEQQLSVSKIILQSMNSVEDQKEFIKEYITTGKFYSLFK